jgi:hypothetical protein
MPHALRLFKTNLHETSSTRPPEGSGGQSDT